MKALFDGDVLVYRSAWAVQKELGEWDGIDVELFLKSYIEDLISDVCNRCRLFNFDIYLSPEDGKTFRHPHLKTIKYKENRKDTEKPMFYSLARDILQDIFSAEVAVDMEADDLLGIRQGSDTIIASVDKDLLMIPGKHYNLRTGKRITVKEGLGSLSFKGGKLTGGGFKWFCAQMLTGDTIDNIPGVRGIGPTKAFRLLRNTRSIKKAWEVVVNTYKEHNNTTLEEHATMLWILREEGQHFEDWLKENIE